MNKKINRTQVGDRFINQTHYESKLVHDKQTDCLNWTGSINNAGYGMIGFLKLDKSKGMTTVHRIALMMKLGREIHSGMNANHLCHNRVCCNPDHLYEGTQTEKMQKMYEQGLLKIGKGIRGERLHKQKRDYKYSDEEIQWVRNADIHQIADHYGVSLIRAGSMQYGFRRSYKWLPWDKK